MLLRGEERADHALIYTDGWAALTVRETVYHLWRFQAGAHTCDGWSLDEASTRRILAARRPPP